VQLVQDALLLRRMPTLVKRKRAIQDIKSLTSQLVEKPGNGPGVSTSKF